MQALTQQRPSSAGLSEHTQGSYRTFLEDCNVREDDGAGNLPCSQQVLERIFVASNVEEGRRSSAPSRAVLDQENNDAARLVRFEFVECVIRIALSKYLDNGAAVDPSGAVRMLMDNHLLPSMGAATVHDRNEYRKTRLYTEEVDAVLKERIVDLRTLFDNHALPKDGSRGQPPAMDIEEWSRFLEKTGITDGAGKRRSSLGPMDVTEGEFTKKTGRLCFTWAKVGGAVYTRHASRMSSGPAVCRLPSGARPPSAAWCLCVACAALCAACASGGGHLCEALILIRPSVHPSPSPPPARPQMHASDELSKRAVYKCVDFFGFLEALCRCADWKHLPTDDQIERCVRCAVAQRRAYCPHHASMRSTSTRTHPGLLFSTGSKPRTCRTSSTSGSAPTRAWCSRRPWPAARRLSLESR
jgi:hypothetical protein